MRWPTDAYRPIGGRRWRDGRGARGRESGSATVLSVGTVAAVVLFAGAFVAVGQAEAARHRAQGAADSAALAGAAKVLHGEQEVCQAASAMAAEAEVKLDGCEVNELEVTVHVSAATSGVPGAFGPARAVSRAGPAMTG